MNFKKIIIFIILFTGLISNIYSQNFPLTEKKENWIITINEVEESYYEIEIINMKEKKQIKTEKFISLPPPRMRWLNDYLLRIDMGSSFAPDISSYFFSINNGKLSERLFFASNFVDLETEVVLCADGSILIQDIFKPAKKYEIKLPNDIYQAACYWFCIGDKTKLEHGVLHLEYLVHDKKWTPEKTKVKKYNYLENM